MKKSPKSLRFILLVIIITAALAACTAEPLPEDIATAVAGTLEGRFERRGEEVTQIVEVTRLVQVMITAKPGSDSKTDATKTPTAKSSTGATPTMTQTPTSAPVSAGLRTATPQFTVSPGEPLNWSLQFFVSKYNQMTDLQRKEFAATLPGRTVVWYASLNNVTEDGLVVMKFPGGMFGSITLKGVPVETAVRINRGDQVEFSGMVESFDSEFSNKLILTNIKIIAFYVEPTATPTFTPTPYGQK